MILYTPLTVNEVLNGWDEKSNYHFERITFKGRDILVSSIPNQQGYRIERLLSTCPGDYLDPSWQPGTIINWQLMT